MISLRWDGEDPILIINWSAWTDLHSLACIVAGLLLVHALP